MNNVVKTKDADSYKYMQSIPQGGTDTLYIATLDENEVYIGSFIEFLSYKVGAERAYLFPGQFDWIGVSA